MTDRGVKFLVGVIPNSWSTGAVLIVGLVAVGIAWRPVVDRTGWRPQPTLLASALLTLTLAVTIGGGDADGRPGGPGCASAEDPGVAGVFLEVGHELESFLNAALLLPLGLMLVLAMRRTPAPLLVVLVLPGLLEVAQLAIPGRVCRTAGYVLNVGGRLVGVAAGAVAVRWAGRRDGVRYG